MEKTILENIKEHRADQREALVNELGIFELRGLAREIGVHSPTTKKRGQLVELILEKLSNGVTEPQMRSKKGRPCKTLNNISQIVNSMTGPEDSITFTSVTKRIKPYSEVVTFAQETPVFSMMGDSDRRDFEGVLRMSERIGYFLDVRSRTKVFVSADYLGKYDIESGDYLEVVASKMNMSNQYITGVVKRINFADPDLKRRGGNSKKQPIISYDLFKYGNFSLYNGRRNIVEYNHNVYEDTRFSQFAKRLIEQGYRVIVLGLNTSFEDGIMLSNIPNIVNMTTTYGDSAESGLDKVVDAISLVQRLCETGQKVVLFVNDIIEVLNTLDLCFEDKDKIMEHSAEAVVIAQKLISLARAYDDGSAVTLVVTYRGYNTDDKFLINEVFKVGNRFKE